MKPAMASARQARASSGVRTGAGYVGGGGGIRAAPATSAATASGPSVQKRSLASPGLSGTARRPSTASATFRAASAPGLPSRSGFASLSATRTMSASGKRARKASATGIRLPASIAATTRLPVAMCRLAPVAQPSQIRSGPPGSASGAGSAPTTAKCPRFAPPARKRLAPSGAMVSTVCRRPSPSCSGTTSRRPASMRSARGAACLAIR